MGRVAAPDRGCQPQNGSGATGRLSGPRRQQLSTGYLVAGDKAEPRREAFDAWSCPKVGAALADQLQRQRGVKPMDLCQIRSQNRIQGRAHIKGRRIDLAVFRSCLWQHRNIARGKHGQRANCRPSLRSHSANLA